ncbi:Peroxisomal leader peptide-processing protease [Chionoecetes opilio]|uniref:Peroxisomal leader peptide-processing protease n=1 Tax=Chionoecetes opilio TaxID=41210 RepID=A0A8J4YFJ4_CHIOP|nr:Peroxisomal leader peptide-processing protease [Chionoecetes opilio]
MQGYGVIVKCSQLVDGANQDLSCSGMYLGHGIVLTHGMLLVDLLKDKMAQVVIEELSTRGYCARTTQQTNVLNSIFKEVQAEFQVILPSKQYAEEVVGINSDPCTSAGIESCPQRLTDIPCQNECFVPHTESDGFQTADAHINRIILQPGVHENLDSLMPASQGWKLLEENQSGIPPNVEKIIMSTFVVLTLSGKGWINEEADHKVVEAAKEILSASITLKKGNFVYIESTPFGSISPSIFLNSLSHGIICNTGPIGQEILLTDARCITGSEGAPVFVLGRGQRWPCALVISPFCWRGGEWLGLTLLVSLGPVLQTLIQSYNSSPLSLPNNIAAQKNFHPTCSTTAAVAPQSMNGFIDRNIMEGPLKDVSQSVVCIKSGEGWGSGLVISTSPGIILTCAHVTYKAIDKEVIVILSDHRRTKGTVIHQTQPLTTRAKGLVPPSAGFSMWDLAVVVTSSPLTQALPLATTLPPQGLGVVVAGYGMFPPRILPTPTLSRGVISKVITLPSSSLHLPASLVSDGSSERHTVAASDCNSNLMSDATSKQSITTSQHNYSVKRELKSDSSHCLMKLSRFPSGNIKKCVPVPVVMQTTCAVYAGSSGGPVVAVHPVHGLQVVGVVVCNMRDSGSVTFPHINLAIPIPTIATILNTFLKTRGENLSPPAARPFSLSEVVLLL